MQTPLVSVVMPTFNRAHLLEKAVRSVLDQSYDHLELLIIDDGSIDNTQELVASHVNRDSRIRYLVNTRRKGPAGARNMGMLAAKGKYIAFLDSDDEWFKHHLESSVRVLENEAEKICFALWIERWSGNEIKIGESQWYQERFHQAIQSLKPRIKDDIIFWGDGFFEFTLLTYYYCYHINTMVFERNILSDISLFDENLPTNEDNDFIFRILHDYHFCLINDYHFIYNQNPDSLYAFIDRSNLDIDSILNNSDTIEKLTFHGKYKNIVRKNRIDMVRRSSKVKDKARCINLLKESIANKYVTLGYINQKLHKMRALNYYIQAMRYNFNRNITLLFLNLLTSSPIYSGKISIEFDLW